MEPRQGRTDSSESVGILNGNRLPPTRTVARMSIIGDPLPLMDGAPDPGVGKVAPILSGQSFDGSRISTDRLRPLVLIFLVHWCPRCQRLLPLVEHLVTDRSAGADVLAVSTGYRRESVNGSTVLEPAEWFATAAPDVPVLVDDLASRGAAAFALSNLPAVVVLGARGVLKCRRAGDISADELVSLVSACS